MCPKEVKTDHQTSTSDTTSAVERTLDRVAGDEIHDFHKFILSCASSCDQINMMLCITFSKSKESVHDDDFELVNDTFIITFPPKYFAWLRKKLTPG